MIDQSVIYSCMLLKQDLQVLSSNNYYFHTIIAFYSQELNKYFDIITMIIIIIFVLFFNSDIFIRFIVVNWPS